MSTASVRRPRRLRSIHIKLLDSSALTSQEEFLWNEDHYPAENYAALAKRLAASGDLFSNGGSGEGLMLVLPDGKHRTVTAGAQLSPIIADRVPVKVIKDGKSRGGIIAATHLNAMLRSKKFLDQFTPVDCITDTPLYLPDFRLTVPGYNDGGQGYRILYVGGEPQVSGSMDTIKSFLGVMEFETNADRTNAVAAALTVTLRNHWPGEKAIILATANKSQAGKDTVISFATGPAKWVSISYQATNWAFERSFVGAIKTTPGAAVVVVENARLDGRSRIIASAFLERFATDPEPLLFSTGTGEPLRIRNTVVPAISTNYGTVSEDLLNRSLPIHLNSVGDVASRKPAIGDPKHDFLPAHKSQIAAELRGMIERWKAAGQPLDGDVQHPFSLWAKMIGGILKVNGFTDFLANYGERKTADDPVRRGLALLGVEQTTRWLRPADWARLAADLGLVKMVIPESDRENDISRTRGIGVVLSAHAGETFVPETELGRSILRLEKHRGRWGGGPETRYRFAVCNTEKLSADEVGEQQGDQQS